MEGGNLLKLSFLPIIVSIIFGIFGSFIGVLWLASMWGLVFSPFLVLTSLHPDIQVFGFLTLFIVGVGYALIPKFKNRRLEYIKLAYMSIAMIVLGDVFIIFSRSSFHSISMIMGYSILLAGSLIFAIIILKILGRPSGFLAPTEFYMVSGVLLLVLSIIARLLSSLSGSPYSYSNLAFLNVVILGFPTMMIFGVMGRTIKFRIAVFRRNYYLASYLFSLIAIILTYLALLSVHWLNVGSSIMFLIAGILFLWSIDAFRRVTSGFQFERMIERDRKRYLYFSTAIVISSAWLLLGLSLGVILSLYFKLGINGVFYLRDSYIHALAIGFIGTTIMAYGPIVIPAILLRRTPYKGLSLVPVYLITIGNSWRVLGNFLKEFFNIIFWPTGLSGILIFAGIIYFLWMFYRLLAPFFGQ